MQYLDLPHECRTHAFYPEETPMLPVLILSAALSPASGVDLHAVNLATISVEDAKKLEGQCIISRLTITAPPDSDDDLTYVGCELDDVERVVHLPKDLLIRKWDEVTIQGELHVITPPAAFVNGQKIPECVEIRVVKAKLLHSSREDE